MIGSATSPNISSDELKALNRKTYLFEEELQNSELFKALISTPEWKKHLQNILFSDVKGTPCLLCDGSYVIWPNRFFDLSSFEKLDVEVNSVLSLQEWWTILKDTYLTPYIDGQTEWLDNHITQTKATDLYSVIDKFLVANDLWRENDAVFFCFPLSSYENNALTICASSVSKRAFVLFNDGGMSDEVWVNIDAERLETLQDFLDNKAVR